MNVKHQAGHHVRQSAETRMSGTPIRDSPCCPQRDDQVTHLKIGERGVVVGLMGLDLIFQQLVALDRLPDEATDAELVGMARRFNYIPNRAVIEADYAAALREAYARFYVTQKPGPPQNPAG
jgi:hypothetical protein